MKNIIIILSITCIGFFNLSAGGFSSFDDERKGPGDDKKNKAKREDTTAFVLASAALANNDCNDDAEITDTTVIAFPSHDLYESWDANSAHPVKFKEAFKGDSITLTLVNEGDSAFVLPFRGDLTSLFGWRRYRPHYGTDIKLNTGEQVVAAFDGMVRLAKYYYGYGNCVIIRHNNGLETVYAHLSKILVESGQTLTAGTVIGLGGNTGHSFGSHLHFEIRFLGQALDTQDFIDFSTGQLKSNEFVLRKIDVENKYDLRALHNRHRHDLGMNRNYSASKSGFYVIRKGDNLERIARRNGTNVKSLCKKNGLKPTTILRIGQRIKI